MRKSPNGAASAIAPELLRALGADVTAISCAPNGVNINDQCGSTHLEQLQKAVVECRADLGLAYDGDADRLQAVDQYGKVRWHSPPQHANQKNPHLPYF
mgnify:CR=1 FL=1